MSKDFEVDLDVDEIWQVHIPDKAKEYDVLATVTTEAPEESTASTSVGKRTLVLTHGREPEPVGGWQNPKKIGMVTSDDGTLHRITIPDRNTALAYFIFGLETHDIGSEESVMENLADFVDLSDYKTWLDDLSKKDRKLRLLELVQYRTSKDKSDWIASKYLDDATWRNTSAGESQLKLAKDIFNNIDESPRECYKTAGRALELHQDNHRVEYVEGLVLPKQAGQSIRHAWIEIDEKVIELTWPWHRFDGKEAVYYGVPIESEEVVHKRERWGGYSPFILSDEEYRRLSSIRHNQSGGK